MCDMTHAELHRLLSEKEEKIAKLEKRIEELENLLRIHDNPHTPPSQRRYPSGNNDGEHHGKPGRRDGHEGVTRPVPEPDRTVKVSANICPKCGALALKCTGQHSRVIEDIPPVQQRIVTEFIVSEYHCCNCGHDFAPTHPDLPKEGRFGNNIIAETAMMRFQCRVPLRKLRAVLMRNHGIVITASSLLSMSDRSAKLLRASYADILTAVKNSPFIYGDETSLKVAGKKWWIWIFVTETETFCIVAASRGSKVLNALEGFNGIMVCDGWDAYTAFTDRIQRCWAHLLREINWLAENVAEACPLAKELHDMFDECCAFVAGNPSAGLRARMKEAMKARMSKVVNGIYETDAMKKFVNKVLNGYDYWFTFLTNPGLEPTNNRAERALREHVVIRKIIGTLRNERGTFIHETVMTALQTWEMRGMNAREKLLEALRS